MVNVLIIEGDLQFAEFAKFAMSRATMASFNTRHVERISEAIEELRRTQYDAVLLDLQLPGSGERDALAEISEYTTTLPVIALAIADCPKNALRAINLGVQDFLGKNSITAYTLERSILYAIERHAILLRRTKLAVEESEIRFAPRASHAVRVTEAASFSDVILENIESMLVTLTPQHSFYLVNKRFVEVFGFAASELKDRTFSNTIAASKEADTIEQAFRQLENGSERATIECNFLTKHGEIPRIEWVFRRLNQTDGAVHSFIGTGIDVTQRFSDRKRLHDLEIENAEARKNNKRENVGTAFERSSPPRAYARQKLSRNQKIWPLHGGGVLTPESFFEVLCDDLSQGGFSFLVADLPTYKNLIVALGEGAAMRYMKAEIRRVEAMKHEGSEMFRVGCKFLERVSVNAF